MSQEDSPHPGQVRSMVEDAERNPDHGGTANAFVPAAVDA
jgi:hypothetical protein